MNRKLEARIRVHGNTGDKSLFEIAVDNWWPNGCYSPKEAYTILYINKQGKGQIVEAEYSEGPTEFKEKIEHNKSPLIEMPKSIYEQAFRPVDGVPEEYKKLLTKEQIQMSVLQAWHFKPLSDENLDYIRKNCFRHK